MTFHEPEDQTTQKKLEALEQRVQHLEKMLGVTAQSAIHPVSETPRSQPAPVSTPTELPPTVSTHSPRKPLNELSLLGTGGMICVGLACIYLIKLAVDAGWLTPLRQVSLAAVFGIGLIITGFKLKLQDKEYLSYLPAAGVVILFISILGGSVYHHLYEPMLALMFTAAVSVATIYIYDRLRLFAYLVLSKVGAYLAPFAFIGTVNVQLIQVYFLLISMTYTVISVMLNERPISVLAAYFGLFATSVFGFSDPTQLPEAGLYLASQAAIFFGGTIYYSLNTHTVLSKKEALLHFPLILFFYGLEYAVISKLYPAEAPFISMAFAGFLLGVYAFMKAKLPKDTELPSEDILMSSAFSVLTHSFYFVLLPDAYQPLFFMLLLLIAAYLYNQVHFPKSWELFRKILMIVGGGLLIWNYALVIFSLLNKDETVWLASGFFMSGGLLGLLKFSNHFKKQQEQIPFLLYTPHLMMASSLYGVFKHTSSFAVSAAWAAYALAILAYGAHKKDRAMARSSMVVLILSSLKVFFYDLSGSNTVGRVLSLLVTGALLYVAGWVFRKVR